MPMQVELTNNSYTQRLQILINGKASSEYSSLRKYMDEPFIYWCDTILHDIYEECNNSRFSLHFSSRKEEMQIMEVLAANDPNCEHYASSPTPFSDSLQDRMRALSRMVANCRDQSVQFLRRDLLFVIPESLRHLENDLLGMEVRNAFCEINAKVTFTRDYLEKRLTADLVILICDDRASASSMPGSSTVHNFEIHIDGSEASSFVAKKSNTFVYKTAEDGLFGVIFNCLLLSPLLDLFRLCIASLPIEITQSYHKELISLQSIFPNVIPVPESTTVEMGRSVRIHFDTAQQGHKVNVADLWFSYSQNGIITCNGLVVEGMHEGTATLYVFRNGENDPCAQEVFKVIKRNRITELTLEEVDICVGEGAHYQLALSYLPPDADNVQKISWQSEDLSVATVDSHGTVVGVSRGSTTIRCVAEQISTRCRCDVKPYLQTITPDEEEINMLVGGEYEVSYRQNPEDCINDRLIMSSMDMRVAIVTGSKLVAISIGSTRVVIQNIDETVRTEITVNVLSERDYNKKQKQKLKEQKARDKKGGWFSKLFGS